MSGIIRVADSFVNIRASFKIGPADIKAHSSLVKRKTGKWLMLDSVKMQDNIKAEVDQLTNNGKDVDAILNVHPFHTASCEWAHNAFPSAKLYGTKRHKDKWPNLPWEQGLLEEPETRALFKDDLDLRIPEGVDFISSNESVHFSSVLAYHAASKTLHVDDTFMFIPTPKVAEIFRFKEGTIQLHPTLVAALQHRKGASQDFRAWVKSVTSDWDMKNICAAHLGTLLGENNTGDSIKSRIEHAVMLAEPVLTGHELFHGKH